MELCTEFTENHDNQSECEAVSQIQLQRRRNGKLISFSKLVLKKDKTMHIQSGIETRLHQQKQNHRYDSTFWGKTLTFRQFVFRVLHL